MEKEIDGILFFHEKTSNVKKAIKETFKIKQEEFNKKWEKYLKKSIGQI